MRILSLLLLLPATAAAQLPTLSEQVRQYVSVSDSVVAITGVRVVDGTGAAPRENQTVVLRGGRIAAVGPAASVAAPRGARVIDGAG
jgi:imidazolonepropionase-like amidohydrolase